jgi:hypothetical protein
MKKVVVFLLLSLAVALSFSYASFAAEVACVKNVGSVTTQSKLNSIPPKTLQERWPSGFKPTLDSCIAISISGELVRGDAEKFRRVYLKNFKTVSGVYLHSPGGDVVEAMEIGRLVRKFLVTLHAPDKSLGRADVELRVSSNDEAICSGASCICASACALIWLGGVERSGGVGFHRPTVSDERFRSLQPAEAAAAYRSVISSISQFMDEMEAPRLLVDIMSGTSSGDISWVSSIDDDEKLRYVPSFLEWINSNCGTISSKDRAVGAGLSYRRAVSEFRGGARRSEDPEPLSESEEHLEIVLTDKISMWDRCKLILVQVSVDKLTAP